MIAKPDGELVRYRGVPNKETENVAPGAKVEFKRKSMWVSTERPIKRKTVFVRRGLHVEDVGTFRKQVRKLDYDSHEKLWDVQDIDKKTLFSQEISSLPVSFLHLDERGETDETQLNYIGNLYFHNAMIRRKLADIKGALAKREAVIEQRKRFWKQVRQGQAIAERHALPNRPN